MQPSQIERSERAKRGSGAEFINQDVSDLAFVRRVLEQAENRRVPVLERVRFLAITGMLLDEFYRIRVAALREQIRSGRESRSVDGMKPAKQLKRADKYSNRLIMRQDRCWRELSQDLEAQQIELVDLDRASMRERQALTKAFREQIRPLLTPVWAHVANELASIKDNDLFVFVALAPSSAEARFTDGLVAIPTAVPRFVALPGKAQRFIASEQLVKSHLDELFPHAQVKASGLARVLREGSLKRFRDGDDLLRLVRDAIERREHAEIIRLRVERDMPPQLLNRLAEILGLLRNEEIKALEKSRRRATASEFVIADSLLGLPDLLQLIDQLRADSASSLSYPAVPANRPGFISSFDGDLFAAVSAKDRLLHFPYDDFNVLIEFLQRAASDESVTSIKQTLYRAGRDSPIVRALAAAAKNGKSVAVVVELQAREDEASNVELAEYLGAAGVDISYGLLDFKVHAKLLIVERMEGGRLKHYVHCSTGNYSVSSGHHYTDLSLFSADETLANEAQQLFAYVHRGVAPTRLGRFSIAPHGLREHISGLIEREISHAAAGRPASIWLKVNRLSDIETIRLLYRASQAGVDIRIVVRGICSLRPGVPGLSETIQVKSVVGRYLEHSRLLCFANGESMPSDTASIFISSADLMAHKLDRRIEALVSIEDADIKRQIQNDIFAAYWRDSTDSWLLNADDRWVRVGDDGFNAQRQLAQHSN